MTNQQNSAPQLPQKQFRYAAKEVRLTGRERAVLLALLGAARYTDVLETGFVRGFCEGVNGDKPDAVGLDERKAIVASLREKL